MLGRTLNLKGELDRFPVSLADLDAIRAYDVNHADGRPWRYLGVDDQRCRTDAFEAYRVRDCEPTPWGSAQQVLVGARSRTEVEAARQSVRYLKWRYGDGWRPPAAGASRPALVEAFNDEIDDAVPPAWVGRIWQNGAPVLVFADAATEAGFAYHDQALAAAVALVRDRMPADWRLWLCRHRRPWIGPMPAGLLDPHAPAAR